jgi:hypothetical protein
MVSMGGFPGQDMRPARPVRRDDATHPRELPDPEPADGFLEVCATCAADPGFQAAYEAFGGALAGSCGHVGRRDVSSP